MAKIIDLVKNAGNVDVTEGIIEEVQKVVPEVALLDAATIKGVVFQTLARIANPQVRFRTIGEPVIASRSSFALRPAECKLLSGRVEISEAEVFANPLMTLEEQEADEGTAVLVAAFKHLADQIWHGKTAGDTKGFDGAPDLVDVSMVTKAGEGADGAANTSVWFLGNDAKKACGLVFSENSKILMGTDVEFRKGDIQTKNAEGDITGAEPGYIGDLTSWVSFSANNKKKLARLCNITAATGLNDDMLTDCIEAYKQANDGIAPDLIFMSYSARKMLRKSRQLTFTDKKGVSVSQYAPIPTDIDEIPLVATNSIPDDELKVA